MEQASLTAWPMRSLRLLRSHSRTVSSSVLAVARVRPSGEKATEDTGPVWSVRGWPRGWGVVGSLSSHSRTVPSLPTVARMCPSGENASDNTALLLALRGVLLFGRPRVFRTAV